MIIYVIAETYNQFLEWCHEAQVSNLAIGRGVHYVAGVQSLRGVGTGALVVVLCFAETRRDYTELIEMAHVRRLKVVKDS